MRLCDDEAADRPEGGIAASTVLAAVPGAWACPECGAGKSDFEMVVI